MCDWSSCSGIWNHRKPLCIHLATLVQPWEWVDRVCFLDGFRLSNIACFGWVMIVARNWRPNSLTTRAARVKKRLPACFRFAYSYLTRWVLRWIRRTVSGCFAQKGLFVLSCSNLGCVSLLFVLLSFLLLCLYVSEQTRSKLPITTSLTYLSISVSYIIGLVSRILSMLAASDFTFSYLYWKASGSVIRIGLRPRRSLRGLKGAFSVLILRHFYLSCFVRAHAQRVLCMASASDRYILGVCADVVLHLCWSALNVAWVDAWVVTVQSGACPWIWLMDRTTRGKTRIVVRLRVLWEG